MKKTQMFGAAIAALAIVPVSALADPVVREQILLDQVFELNGVNDTNSVTGDFDVATDPDEESGDSNLQDNTSVQPAPPAESTLLQSLTGQVFNRDSADASYAQMHNTVVVNITATGPLSDDADLNTGAGAFNLQMNTSVVASVAADDLAGSLADVQQDSQLNISVLQDVVNELTPTIVLDGTSANVGINSVAGVGNAQLNSATMTVPFF